MIYLGPDGRYMTYEECRTSGHNPGVSLINYGKQETVDYVVDLINDTVKTYGLSVYRQDFNTNSSPYWDAYDVYERETYGIPRVGITQIKSCEGYVKAWTAISEANPGLVFDACASGGRRLDLETLRFSFAHTKSDYWDDVISQQGQNFGSLSWIPFTGTGFLDMTSTYDIRSRLTLSIGVGGIEPGDIQRLQLSAFVEHEGHVRYAGGVKPGNVQRLQPPALVEHRSHAGHPGGVEPGNVQRLQGLAGIEHVGHRGHL